VAALVAAELVAILHMAYLVYMIFGGFLALHRFAWIWPHIVSTVYSIYVTTTSFTCPVTTLEKWLLVRGGETPYEGSFIAHYLRGVLYPPQYEKALWLTGWPWPSSRTSSSWRDAGGPPSCRPARRGPESRIASAGCRQDRDPSHRASVPAGLAWSG